MESPLPAMCVPARGDGDTEVVHIATGAASERQELLPRVEQPPAPSSPCGSERTLSLPSPARLASVFVQRSRSDVHGTLSLEEGPGGDGPPADRVAPGSAGARQPSYLCGVDTRRGFPLAFVSIVSLGGLYTFTGQRCLLEGALGGGARPLLRLVGAGYALAFGCMARTALCDPGCLGAERYSRHKAGEQALPWRAHKNFQYERPVLRFDHYCRWLTNCIGLRNHREFMVMLSSLLALALLGLALDFLLPLSSGPPPSRPAQAALALHLAGSVAFCWLVAPVWRLHCGLISRSELAFEWKWEQFQVIRDHATGKEVAVAGLGQSEYEARRATGTVGYDPALNRFDKGWSSNCLAFWCTARWAPEQLGEF